MCSNAVLNDTLVEHSRKLDKNTEAVTRVAAAFAVKTDEYDRRLEGLEDRERLIKGTVDRAAGKSAVWTIAGIVLLQAVAAVVATQAGWI